MSLWTPYNLDQPLDLSKPAFQQFIRENSPISERSESWCLSDVDRFSSPSPPQQVPDSESCNFKPSINVTRPFKAVTSLPAANPDPSYEVFKNVLLDAMRARNGGSLTVSNPRMRRSVRRSNSSEDEEYLQRRARNNAAAKRSRDLRRQKEDELAIRAAYLVNMNAELQAKLDAAKRCHQCLNLI